MTTPEHGNTIHRSHIPEPFKWDISHIYPSQAEWEKACTAITNKMKQMESCKGHLAEPAILLRTLKLRDQLAQEIEKSMLMPVCSKTQTIVTQPFRH